MWTIRANNSRKRSHSSFGPSIHTHANVHAVRSVKCNSREQLANEANFRLIFYILILAGRKLYLKSKQYAGLNNVLSWSFAILLCIPSQIDARQPAIRWLSSGDLLISVFLKAYVYKSPGLDGIHPRILDETRSIITAPLKNIWNLTTT